MSYRTCYMKGCTLPPNHGGEHDIVPPSTAPAQVGERYVALQMLETHAAACIRDGNLWAVICACGWERHGLLTSGIALGVWRKEHLAQFSVTLPASPLGPINEANVMRAYDEPLPEVTTEVRELADLDELVERVIAVYRRPPGDGGGRKGVKPLLNAALSKARKEAEVAARLDEAKWWQRNFPKLSFTHNPLGVCQCAGCAHVAALANPPEGRAKRHEPYCVEYQRGVKAEDCTVCNPPEGAAEKEKKS